MFSHWLVWLFRAAHSGGLISLALLVLGVSLSCFSPERKHKFSKKICDFAYRNCSKTMLAYDVKNMEAIAAKSINFHEIHMIGNIKALDSLVGASLGIQLFVAKAMCTSAGTFYEKDIALCRDGGVVTVCKLDSFLNVVVNGRARFFVVAYMLTRETGAVYSANVGATSVLSPSDLVASCPFRIVGESLHVVVPSVIA